MSARNDGGPAFPFQASDGVAMHNPCYGMTLRDYFAAKAMAAIIIGNGADGSTLTLGAAKDAYAVADAMLAARDA